MEKRFIAAFALSILILLGWQIVSKKLMPQEPPPVTAVTPSPGATSPPATAAPDVAASGSHAAPPPGAPAPASSPASAAVSASAEQEVHLDTELAEIVLTNKGGRVRSWRLKKFESAGRPVDFVSAAARRDDQLPLSLVFDDRQILPGINDALFDVSRTEETKGATRVSFHWSDGAGSEVRKTFEFRAAEPIVGVEVTTIDRGRMVTPRLTWGPGLEVEDPNHRSNTYYNGYALTYDGRKVTHYKKQNIHQPIAIPEAAHLTWAGLDDQYFTVLVLPAGATTATIAPFSASALATPGKSVPDDVGTAPVIAIALPEGKAQLFVGPKNFELLRSLGHGFEQAIWFSSYELIYFCAKPIFLALRFVHDHWVPNYGVAIILLTLGLRIVLFPLNQFSMVKMRKVAGEMQRVQPKVKAIQAKYKKSKDPDARAKMNTETMDLYKREGVNPFGSVSGCLPLFVQMPILWAFYDVLTAAVELRGAPFFGWIHDLTHPDGFYVTPILMGITMFVQQKMTPTANVDPQQQKVMLLMPVFFTWVFVSLPSGLVLYYFVNNLLGIGQQWLVNRHIARLEAAPHEGVMDAIEFDGKDLEDALAAAAAALGCPVSELDYEILEGGRKGVFGLGARPFRIRVVRSGGRAVVGTDADPRHPAEPALPAVQAGAALSPPGTALREIFDKMGFDLRLEEARRDGALELTVDGPDLSRLTAKDGDLLSALEFVLNRMGRRAWPDEPPVHLLGRGFRSERDDELVLLVREAAVQVARSGMPRRLREMNPYERRVVHMTVREHPGLTSVSEGDGFLKRVRVEKLTP